ncbi:MAG: transposase [bacterium]|nr:transposase [bacterium]
MRKIRFVNGGFYHIYNRGVYKSNIFNNKHDVERFLQCMDEFNTVALTGSLFENSFATPELKAKRKAKRLVNIVAYCLNPNHYHFILEQVAENGISQFMKRLGGGYSWYFNNRYHRSGALFQGAFKAKHINSNEYLLYLSVYINLNNKVHKLGDLVAKLVKSSWEEYTTKQQVQFCKKDIILGQVKSLNEYKAFALDTLPALIQKKEQDKEFADLLFEN